MKKNDYLWIILFGLIWLSGIGYGIYRHFQDTPSYSLIANPINAYDHMYNYVQKHQSKEEIIATDYVLDKAYYISMKDHGEIHYLVMDNQGKITFEGDYAFENEVKYPKEENGIYYPGQDGTGRYYGFIVEDEQYYYFVSIHFDTETQQGFITVEGIDHDAYEAYAIKKACLYMNGHTLGDMAFLELENQERFDYVVAVQSFTSFSIVGVKGDQVKSIGGGYDTYDLEKGLEEKDGWVYYGTLDYQKHSVTKRVLIADEK